MIPQSAVADPTRKLRKISDNIIYPWDMGIKQFKDEVFQLLGVYLALVGTYIMESVEYRYKQLLKYR